MLPRFEVVDRLRPVDLLAPGDVRLDRVGVTRVDEPAGALAPYLTVIADLPPGTVRVRLGWTGSDLGLTGVLDGDRVGLEVTGADGTRTHASRRLARLDAPPRGLALTLTGTHLTLFARDERGWLARARVDLEQRVDTHDEQLLATLRIAYDGPGGRVRAGGFGWLGLRDLHAATYADGGVVRHEGRIVLTATHAGPGFFDTGHTGVWTYDPVDGALDHRADLFFRRPGRSGSHDRRVGVFGDHATHLVRDGDGWLVATSTWGDFDRTGVGVTLSRTDADLLAGRHVLDSEPLVVPVDAVGVWDPHLTRIEGRWWVAVTAARRFFDFRPALCSGPDLASLALVATDESRTATEGTVLTELDGRWRVLASDGRDNPRGSRTGFGVYDLGLRRIGALDAPYPTNLPWPNLVADGDGWLMLTFDGTPYGGERRGVLGYGTHGDVVVMRARAVSREPSSVSR